jgi:allantoinase
MVSPFAIISKRVVAPDGIHPAAILVDGEKIVGLESPSAVPARFRVEDVGNSVAMPGLVDTHVHINEPGRTEWEGFETGTKAAAAGGITTIVDMPLNSSPVTTSVEALQKKISSAQNKSFVDCGLYGGLVPGNEDNIEPLINAGVYGIKTFLTDSGIEDFPQTTERELRSAMPVIARENIPLLVHAEIESDDCLKLSSTKKYKEYEQTRPPSWERSAIEMMIRLSKEFNCKTHIVHLSSAQQIELLADAKRDGLPLTVETCPHYLFFSSESIPDGATEFKCAPPIRDKENREKLWEGLKNGTIDCIVSDHSPCPPEMKAKGEGDFMKAWGGIASLQFGLPVVWTEAKHRGFSLMDIVRWMSGFPAKLVGLSEKKGSLAQGHDADIVIFNPDESFILSSSMILHRHKLTPYEGRKLVGIVEKTFLRGNLVFDHGSPGVKPEGKILQRKRHDA